MSSIPILDAETCKMRIMHGYIYILQQVTTSHSIRTKDVDKHVNTQRCHSIWFFFFFLFTGSARVLKRIKYSIEVIKTKWMKYESIDCIANGMFNANWIRIGGRPRTNVSGRSILLWKKKTRKNFNRIRSILMRKLFNIGAIERKNGTNWSEMYE